MSDGPGGYRELFAHRGARGLVVADAASALGDFVGLGALLVVATERAGGVAVGAAGIYAVQAIPGLFAGSWLSGRIAILRPRPALFWSSMVGAASIAFVLLVGGLWPVYATALVLGISRSVKAPMVSKQASIGVPTTLRTRLFALFNGNFQGAQVPGLLLGGGLAGTGLSAVALWFDVATFLVAALFYLALPTVTGPSTGSDREARRASDGIRLALTHPVARAVVPVAWASFLVGALPEAVVPSVVDGALVGVVLAAGPAATMTGALLLGRGARLDRPGSALGVARAVPLGITCMALAFLLPGGVGAAILLALANAVLGFSLAWVVGAQSALATSLEPDDLAQVNATMIASVLVLEGVGALAVSALADAVSPGAAFAVIGLVTTPVFWSGRDRLNVDDAVRPVGTGTPRT